MTRPAFVATSVCCWTLLAMVCAAQEIAPTKVRLQAMSATADAPVVTALAIDPQGQLIAAAGDDHVIRMLRQEDLEEVAKLEKHTGWVRALAFSPDGRTLASAGDDGRMVLWQRGDAWTVQHVFDGAPALFAIRFAPRGGLLGAVGFDPQLFLIGPGGAQRSAMQCGCRDMRTVAFSDDGGLVAAAGRSGDIHLFEPATGQLVATYGAHTERVREAIFLKGSRTLVSVGEDGLAVVLDTTAGQVLHKIRIQSSKLLAVAQLDDRHVAVSGADNDLRIADLQRGAIVRRLPGHTGSVSTLTANERYLFSGSFDTTIGRWSLAAIKGGPRVAETEPAERPEVRTSRLPAEN